MAMFKKVLMIFYGDGFEKFFFGFETITADNAHPSPDVNRSKLLFFPEVEKRPGEFIRRLEVFAFALWANHDDIRR